MALLRFACGLILIVIFLCKGCVSQAPACGMVNTRGRIVGGEDAAPGSWPWQAYLEINGYVCGGSLINDRWVMTAAHCISPSDLNKTTVYLGRNNQSGPNPMEESRKLQHIKCHPNYADLNNDICLLKLASPVTFSDYIQPVCLASSGSRFHSGEDSWVTGFGTVDSGDLAKVLQEVKVPIVGQRECRCSYGDDVITENMICAGLRAGGKDSCQGDSGGPMVLDTGMGWVQNGIVSFGYGCGEPTFPGVYAKVSRYERWIRSVVNSSDIGFISFTSSGIDPDIFISCELPTNTPTYPTTTTTNYVTWDDDSVFDSSSNLLRSTHFLSLSAAGLLLHMLVGGGTM